MDIYEYNNAQQEVGSDVRIGNNGHRHDNSNDRGENINKVRTIPTYSEVKFLFFC